MIGIPTYIQGVSEKTEQLLFSPNIYNSIGYAQMVGKLLSPQVLKSHKTTDR